MGAIWTLPSYLSTIRTTVFSGFKLQSNTAEIESLSAYIKILNDEVARLYDEADEIRAEQERSAQVRQHAATNVLRNAMNFLEDEEACISSENEAFLQVPSSSDGRRGTSPSSSPASRIRRENRENADSELDPKSTILLNRRRNRQRLLSSLLTLAEAQYDNGIGSLQTSESSTSLSPTSLLSTVSTDTTSLSMSTDSPEELTENSSSLSTSLSFVLERSALDDTTKRWLWQQFNEWEQNEGSKHYPFQRSQSIDQPGLADDHFTNDEPTSPSDSSLSSFANLFPVPIKVKPSTIDLTFLSNASPDLFTSMDSWEFSIFSLSSSDLQILPYLMFRRFHLFEILQIEVSVFATFVSTLASYYRNLPYHSFIHGVDVLHCCYIFTLQLELCTKWKFSPSEIFAFFVAAIAHDVNHPGTTNQFQVASVSDWSLLYNDQSVLENMHASFLFAILSRPGCQLLKHFSKNDFLSIRRLIVDCILQTDMKHHFELCEKFDNFISRLREAEPVVSDAPSSPTSPSADLGPSTNANGLNSRPAQHQNLKYSISRDKIIENEFFANEATLLPPTEAALLLGILLHSADVSNSCKPYSISKQWSTAVFEEFLAQGDQEKRLGIKISPFMDRDDGNTRKLETVAINFIDFIVAPLCCTLLTAFPSLHKIKLADHLAANRSEWEKQRLEKVKDLLSQLAVNSDTTNSDTAVLISKQREQLGQENATMHKRADRFAETVLATGITKRMHPSNDSKHNASHTHSFALSRSLSVFQTLKPGQKLPTGEFFSADAKRDLRYRRRRSFQAPFTFIDSTSQVHSDQSAHPCPQIIAPNTSPPSPQFKSYPPPLGPRHSVDDLSISNIVKLVNNSIDLPSPANLAFSKSADRIPTLSDPLATRPSTFSSLDEIQNQRLARALRRAMVSENSVPITHSHTHTQAHAPSTRNNVNITNPNRRNLPTPASISSPNSRRGSLTGLGKAIGRQSCIGVAKQMFILNDNEVNENESSSSPSVH